MNSTVEHWIRIIINRKIKSFCIAFTFVLITALSMRPTSFCLVTSETPLAIVDLELAFDQQKALSIKELWKGCHCANAFALASVGINAAIINIFLDFPFLVAYSVFLVVLIILSQGRDFLISRKTTIPLIYTAVLAGSLDAFENIFMLIFLKVSSVDSYLFAIPATVKFGLIALVIIAILLRMIRILISKII